MTAGGFGTELMSQEIDPGGDSNPGAGHGVTRRCDRPAWSGALSGLVCMWYELYVSSWRKVEGRSSTAEEGDCHVTGEVDDGIKLITRGRWKSPAGCCGTSSFARPTSS